MRSPGFGVTPASCKGISSSRCRLFGGVLRKWVRYARLEAADIRTPSPDDRSKKLAFFKSSVRWFISRWRASRAVAQGAGFQLDTSWVV